jgi:hypothetical protein
MLAATAGPSLPSLPIEVFEVAGAMKNIAAAGIDDAVFFPSA